VVISMTALTADATGVDAGSGPALHGASAVRTTGPDRSGDLPEDRSGVVTSSRTAVRSWPLLVLAVPAAAEVWSGWVGIARLTGFGMVSPLPGIWPSLHLDTSITLPVGVEAYAAYALRAWLAGEHAVSPRTRRFAKWSAMLSFALGMAGQVTYHLLAGAGATRAPWAITTIVSCLPVLVLAMGTTLAHMLRTDARAAGTADEHRTGQPGCWSVSWSPEDQAWSGPDQEAAEGPVASGPRAAARRPSVRDCLAVARTPAPGPRTESSSAEQARLLAGRLATAGKPVSRRALRNGGVRGSNEALNRLARELNAKRAPLTAWSAEALSIESLRRVCGAA
jgi:hypothetical protein